MKKELKVVYISWAPYCSRSDYTARELGGTSYMVYLGWLGSNICTILLKYFGQFVKTLRILFREKPNVVFVMTPPVFAVIQILVYANLKNIPFIIDAHSGAFLHPRWRYFQNLQLFFCRLSTTTIVTNEYLVDYIKNSGGHATIIRDVPVIYEKNGEFNITDDFAIAVICSFDIDEPVEEILLAIKRLQDIKFYITGDLNFLDSNLIKNAPENVVFTGFLSDSEYGSLLTNVLAVLTLTTTNHTMLRSAYEAIYQGTPVIISDWPILRKAFDKGAVHTKNEAEEIIFAVRHIKKEWKLYKRGALYLRQQKIEEWKIKKNTLVKLIQKERFYH